MENQELKFLVVHINEIVLKTNTKVTQKPNAEMTNSIVNGIGIGFLSCIGIGIGIVKTIFQVLVLVLLRGFPNNWYWYWYC